MDEDGDVTVSVSFDPQRFSRNADNPEKIQKYTMVPRGGDTVPDEILTDRDNSGKTAKESQLGLDRLIRCINVDCFTEKVFNSKTIENRQSFSTYVYHRTKKVRLSRNEISARLNTMGVMFHGIFSIMLAVEKTDRSDIM